jgi:hypothetical protein
LAEYLGLVLGILFDCEKPLKGSPKLRKCHWGDLDRSGEEKERRDYVDAFLASKMHINTDILSKPYVQYVMQYTWQSVG